MTFAELGLCPEILTALADQKYSNPSPIQEKAIPHALAGRDVLGCAQTGTGKTCAFSTPIIQRLGSHKQGIRALILTPTRELAIQIFDNILQYSKNTNLKTAVIFGGVSQGPQVAKVKGGLDILVATPGRLGDLYQQKLLDLSHVECFVLDEADRMLDMGFIHDVNKILKWLPEKKQTLFFSATMPPEIIQLVDTLLVDPIKVEVDPVSSPVEVITQELYFVDKHNKSNLLCHIIEERKIPTALIFTRTKHGANKVVKDLQKQGISGAAIHGNKSQTARQQALENFKAGKIQCLVATDIAARGIDIDRLSYVFNYNLPEVPETYIHRIGRTGRAGRDGIAIAFCEFGEKPLLKDIEKVMGKSVSLVETHPYPMTVFEALKKDRHGRIVNSEDEEARAAARERKKQRDETSRNRGQSNKGRGKDATSPQSGKRGNPLSEGDQVMDATARMLAPKGAQPQRSAKPQRQSNRNQVNHNINQNSGKSASGDAHVVSSQRRKGDSNRQGRNPEARSSDNRSGQGRNQTGNRSGNYQGGGNRSGGRNQQAPRAGKTDSTEQRSLMKPFYLDF